MGGPQPAGSSPAYCYILVAVSITCFSLLLQELGAVSLDGYFHLWKAENTLSKV